MKNALIVFARHGAYHQPQGVPSALLPHPLTEQGFEQAKEGAQELLKIIEQKSLPLPKKLFCSTSLRAYQTAQVYAEQLSSQLNRELNIIQSDQLCERSVGPLANLTVEQIEDIISKVQEKYSEDQELLDSLENLKSLIGEEE